MSPAHETTTPVQTSLRALRGEWRSTDISGHCGIGVALRDSMRFLRIRPAFVGSSNLVGAAVREVDSEKMPDVSSLLVLMGVESLGNVSQRPVASISAFLRSEEHTSE